jgi:hypothetical protein
MNQPYKKTLKGGREFDTEGEVRAYYDGMRGAWHYFYMLEEIGLPMDKTKYFMMIEITEGISLGKMKSKEHSPDQ